MNRTFFLLLLFVAVLSPGLSGAQYLYLDANGDGVHTDADVVNPSGSTHVAIWLDTSHDRDGSAQTCNSHTGAPVHEGPDLDIFSYDVFLVVDDGAVSWEDYTDRMGFEKLPNDDVSTRTETQIHITRFAAPGDERPAGRYKLGSMTVTTTGGTPSIRFGLMEGWDYCAFGTDCSASLEFPNSYVLGVDFTDADGLPYGGVINHRPSFDSPPPITVVENHVANLDLHATDVDQQPLTFTMTSGPDYVTILNGMYPGQGTLHAEPGSADVGVTNVSVRVSDGVYWSDRIVPVNVRRELTMGHQVNASIAAGTIWTRNLFVDNPLAQAVTFYLRSAPPFVRIQPGTATAPTAVIFSPAVGDVGTYSVTLGVTNGTVRDEASFTLEVLASAQPPDNPPGGNGNRPPVAVIQGPSVGIVDRPVPLSGALSYDPDGDALTLTWSFGDGGAVASGQRVEHRYAGEGSYRVDLTARDKENIRVTSWSVNIVPVAPARAFVSGAGRRDGSEAMVRVQPLGGIFAASEITAEHTASFSLTNDAGRSITAIGIDPVSALDSDQDGTPDAGILFAPSEITQLVDEGARHGVATLTLRGELAGGGTFIASLAMNRGHGGALSAALSPNPINPLGHLSFVTSRPGRADVKIFDIAGRLAHHPIDRGIVPAGYHELLVGRGRTGGDLPSGVYFYRIETEEGVARGRFAVVR
jgi:hypothetical protein